MELVRITALGCYRLNRNVSKTHQFSRIRQALADQIFLRSTAYHLFKLPAEIVTVQLTETCHFIDSQLTVIILLDIDHSFIDIKILLGSLFNILPAVGIFDKLVQKQI